jgi:hypothetical protein
MNDDADLGFDNVDKLRNEGRFGDVVMICWGHVEIYIGLLTSYEIFGMYNDAWLEDGWDLIQKASLDWKLSLLRLKGSLMKQEYDAIKKFQKRRNKELFHLYGNASLNAPKQTIMNQAIEAATAAETAYHEVVELGRVPDPTSKAQQSTSD